MIIYVYIYMDNATIAFINRTFRHIRRVQDNAVFLIENYADNLQLSYMDCRNILSNIAKHDLSKWSEAQFEPYINKFNRKIEDGKFKDAWKHHYSNENHHYQDGKIFTKIELIEVICDLQAMSQEFNEVSCRKYFKEVWIPEFNKWGNSNKGTNLSMFIADEYAYHSMISYMYQIIDCFENNINQENKNDYIS